MNTLLEIAAHPRDWLAFRRAAKVRDCPAFAHRRWFAEWSRTGATPLGDELPWMTFAATDFLRGWLRKDMNVFEWGSGGSTVFFARHAARVIAVEHEDAWAAQVRDAIGNRGISNAQLEHLPPEPDAAAGYSDVADPSVFASSGEVFRGHSFQRYVTFIDQYPDAEFDLVVVDGRARPSCIQRGLAKVKPGGFLLLDNAERPHYTPAKALLDPAGWELHDFTGPGPYCRQFWRTLAWRRKS